jgi:hypothetical protein
VGVEDLAVCVDEKVRKSTGMGPHDICFTTEYPKTSEESGLMGIGDWFKRFKQNTAAFEEYREGVAQEPGRDESQAARAGAEHSRVSSESASASKNRSGSGDE